MGDISRDFDFTATLYYSADKTTKVSFPVGTGYPENVLTVGEHVTFDERKNIINVDIHSNDSDNVYVKEVHFTLKNLSDSAIRQIAVDKIMFSGFKYAGEEVKATTCIGAEKYKFINELILPDDTIEVTVKIYFDDIIRLPAISG